MSDYSTPRVSRHRAHNQGNHGECRAETCKKRAEIERRADETKHARSALDYCTNHGIDWSVLGSELPEIRRKARQNIPSWLTEECAVTWDSMIEAAYWYNLR